jgi:hypothetical protein
LVKNSCRQKKGPYGPDGLRHPPPVTWIVDKVTYLLRMSRRKLEYFLPEPELELQRQFTPLEIKSVFSNGVRL